MHEYCKGASLNYLRFDWDDYRWHSDADYAVIINFNGVLLRGQEIDREAWKWVFDQLRVLYEEDKLGQLMHTGLPTKEILLINITRNTPEVDLSLVAQLTTNWAVAKEQWQTNRLRENGQPMEGAEKLLQALTQKRIPVGMYSMFSLHSVLVILHHIRLKQFFSAVVTPELIRRDFRALGTFPGCLSEVIDRLSTKPENCFLLEDSAACVGMARNLGVICIGVGLENKSQLKEKGAICVVDNHDRLLYVFQNARERKEVVQQLRALDQEL